MTFRDLTPAQWAAYDEALMRRHPEWIPDPLDAEDDRPRPVEASGEEESAC